MTINFRSGGGLLSDFVLQTDSDWECSFNVKLTSGDGGRIGLTSADGNGIERNYIGFRNRSSRMEISASINSSTDNMISQSYNTNTEYDIKLINTNGNVEFYVNGVSITTVNGFEWLNRPLYIYTQSWANQGSGIIRDFLFKPL